MTLTILLSAEETPQTRIAFFRYVLPICVKLFEILKILSMDRY